MPWLIVLGEQAAAAWVLKHQRMAFRATVRTHDLEPGQRIAIYVTRGAFHNPGRDEAQIVAIGHVSSPVTKQSIEIAGSRYDQLCSLTVESQLPLRQGLPFRPLVEHLGFITNKDAWPVYLRRTIVSVSDDDFNLIKRAFNGFIAQSEAIGFPPDVRGPA